MTTMTLQVKIMVTTRQDSLTYLINKNKGICLWHQQLAHTSDTCWVKTVKLINGISLEQQNKKYNLMKVILDLDNSDVSDCLNPEVTPIKNQTKA